MEWHDFDLRALHRAMDEKRQAHSMSWAEVARAIHSFGPRDSTRHLSTSTITGLRSRRSAEGDGVLQMLRWLGVPPEHFCVTGERAGLQAPALPEIAPGHVLRFDAKAIYAALDAARERQRLPRSEVARSIGDCAPANLTRLEKGGRIGFPHVMRLLRWLDRPAAAFVRASPW